MLKDKPYTFIIDEFGEIQMYDSCFSSYLGFNDSANLFDYISPETEMSIRKCFDQIGHDLNYHLNAEIVLPNRKSAVVGLHFSALVWSSGNKKMFLVKLFSVLDNVENEKDTAIFEFIFNNINDAVFLTDIEGRIINMNQNACKIVGISKSEMLGLNLYNLDFIYKENKTNHYFSDLKMNGHAVAFVDYRDKEHQLFHFEVFGKTVHYCDQDLILHVSREISPVKLECNQLFDAIIQAEETDRSFFAREIHEGLGQILSLIKLYLESYFDTDKPEFRNELAKKMDYSINQALSIVSFITEKLSPHILKNLGIESALNAYVQKLSTKSDTKIELEIKIKEKIPDHVEIVIYRTIIELIDYCLNDPKVTLISISAEKIKNNILFVLAQNGQTFRLEDFTKSSENIRIYNLINKIQSLNGSFEINNKMKQRAQIHVVVPIL